MRTKTKIALGLLLPVLFVVVLFTAMLNAEVSSAENPWQKETESIFDEYASESKGDVVKILDFISRDGILIDGDMLDITIYKREEYYYKLSIHYKDGELIKSGLYHDYKDECPIFFGQIGLDLGFPISSIKVPDLPEKHRELFKLLPPEVRQKFHGEYGIQ